MKKIEGQYNLKKNIYAYFIIPLILLVAVSLIFKFNFDKKANSIMLNEIRENEIRLVSLESEYLGNEFSTIITDLHYLHHAYEEDIINSDNLSDVAENWKEFSLHKKIYDQVRYLDRYGNEKIRINYKNGISSIVPENELQNKYGRYYFYEAVKLNLNDVFISRLDLNIENKLIENPLKPMIRFSTPLYNNKNRNEGIVVLNYLAENNLKKFRELGEASLGEIVLLNSEGYWLSSENSNLEWNFMFADRRNITFDKLYTEEWELIKKNEEEIITDNGLFFIKPVILGNKLSAGDIESQDDKIHMADTKWYVVSVVKSTNREEIIHSSNFLIFLTRLINYNGLYLLITLIISGLISYLIYLNRGKYIQLKWFSEMDSLTKVFNRRAGIEKLQQRVATGKHSRISICFVDINGLKQINDELGHTLGDELIISAVDIIKSEIKEEDLIIRMGGDEFLIVFKGVESNVAELIWHRITEKINKLNESRIHPFIISISHGIVDCQSCETQNIDELIKIADEKMYVEKGNIKKYIKDFRRQKNVKDRCSIYKY